MSNNPAERLNNLALSLARKKDKWKYVKRNPLNLNMCWYGVVYLVLDMPEVQAGGVRLRRVLWFTRAMKGTRELPYETAIKEYVVFGCAEYVLLHDFR